MKKVVAGVVVFLALGFASPVLAGNICEVKHDFFYGTTKSYFMEAAEYLVKEDLAAWALLVSREVAGTLDKGAKYYRLRETRDGLVQLRHPSSSQTIWTAGEALSCD